MALVLPAEAAEIVEGCSAGWIAAGDGPGVPEAARVMGALVGRERCTITALVPTLQSGRLLDLLAARPWAAVFFSRVIDYTSVQIKGEVTSVRPTGEEERRLQARYLQRFADGCEAIHIDRRLTEQMVLTPSFAVEVQVGELFVQTPGPRAGQPWR
jgi:hypothetical protein